jgi:predicted TIM-barrel fold metal-dependent hydrolase
LWSYDKRSGILKLLFDMHVHITDELVESSFSPQILAASAAYFRTRFRKINFDEFEKDLVSQGVGGYALLPLPAKGLDPQRYNKAIVNYVSRSESAVGFAAVNPDIDPSKTMIEARTKKLVGLKVHPTLQEVRPDDRRLYPAYEVLSSQTKNGVVVVHTGTSGLGGGLRGGGGFKIEYSRPVYVDNVAADFPDVNFVMAHFGWPWTLEAVAVAAQKANVYLDLSGWSPKYIPAEIWTYAKNQLSDRVLFGSDYPFIQPSRWVQDFGNIPLPQEVKNKILSENARKLFSK